MADKLPKQPVWPSGPGGSLPSQPEGSGAKSESGMEVGRGLVRVTVNLTPRAVDALDSACSKTKDTKTDSINRALVVYDVVLELIERGGGHLTFQNKDGHTEIVHLL
ncbi:hypothetical protein EDC02_7852 [Micromonospora sp. Llam0]|uniref:hypothetical protein n=1 Tax=Micromonospora sp. Llam0 TaxID=2485143 RepID=UPI000F974830|nr:hypothetical protein [Micromonospora sp. Llam0]ROO52901.1 hypothetical protein EDC02_7852 [Micromonospora sp. Llam0]